MNHFLKKTFALWMVLMLLAPSALPQTDSDRILEHKSALIFKLSTFVTWPDDTFDKKKEPLVIGVLGSRKIHGYLSNSTRKASLMGHPIKVVGISMDDDWNECHIIFVDSSVADSFINVYAEKINDLPILTFGDSPTFEKEGGVIRIYEQGTKHKISVNIDAASRKNLKIDHRLLELADIVKDS